MNSDRLSLRSPELMSRADTALLVVDMQEKLVPLIQEHAKVTWNVRRLIDAAQILSLKIAATEQYPKGLGSTVASLAEKLVSPPSKTLFSCRECVASFESWREGKVGKVLVCGIEAHVCVQQTALDLVADGYRVYIAADAIGSRNRFDYDIALRRMELAGCTLTTTEAAIFEWCETASAPEFKQISALVREAPPS
jgi:nicotinamidase-related amidase